MSRAPAGFTDRAEAGARLAEQLLHLAGEMGVVYGLPRGGVIVAAPVALALGWPLRVMPARKLTAPLQRELAIGAIAGSRGVGGVDSAVVELLGVDPAYIEREREKQLDEIRRQMSLYGAPDDEGTDAREVAVVVDDGIATGQTALAALNAVRSTGASRVILAAPLAPPATMERFRRECDEVIVLLTPEPFVAVGAWYRDFRPVSDAEVIEAIRQVNAACQASKQEPQACAGHQREGEGN